MFACKVGAYPSEAFQVLHSRVISTGKFILLWPNFFNTFALVIKARAFSRVAHFVLVFSDDKHYSLQQRVSHYNETQYKTADQRPYF
jgi:hypothetical protein